MTTQTFDEGTRQRVLEESLRKVREEVLKSANGLEQYDAIEAALTVFEITATNLSLIAQAVTKSGGLE